MKSVLGMFKGRNSDGSAVTENSNYESDFEYNEGDASNDVFEEFTDKVQQLLDDGAMSLEIAEEKTSMLEGIDPSAQEYSRLVEEIKVAQADARQNFDDAEFLIQRANEILESNAN